MKYKTKAKGIVMLADGTVFHGMSAGILGTAIGEICFNTSMSGYQETYTDLAYTGQILVNTTAHIGGYGVNENENESDKVGISALICKNFSDNFSRKNASTSLQNYFESNNIVVITDVDSRALVRHIRDKGAMNAVVSSIEFDFDKLKEKLEMYPLLENLELASKVSTKKAYILGDEKSNLKVALIDYGVKMSLIQAFVERGAKVKVFPMQTEVNDILAWKPKGIVLSNGPGNPLLMKESIQKVKDLTHGNIPILGISLGHQLLALAAGAETEKMAVGHRGSNHPVHNLLTGKSEVTAQNHGFVVTKSSVEKNDTLEITHIHLNDNTIAGLRYKNKFIFSVQFLPEASPGPHDSKYLFDNFIETLNTAK